MVDALQDYNRQRFFKDLGAGLTVGVVALREMDGAARWAFAAPALRRSTPDAIRLAAVCSALGLQTRQVKAAQVLNNGPEWLGLLIDSPDTLMALTPDHIALKALGQKVGVAALSTPAHGDHQAAALIARSSREARAFERATTAHAPAAPEPDLWVRAFAAPVGVDEDPVTGSLNASLAQWLMADGVLPTRYQATQGQALGRDGQVFLSRDEQAQVWVGGDVVCCISGEVQL